MMVVWQNMLKAASKCDWKSGLPLPNKKGKETAI